MVYKQSIFCDRSPDSLDVLVDQKITVLGDRDVAWLVLTGNDQVGLSGTQNHVPLLAAHVLDE